MIKTGEVGPSVLADGAEGPLRLGRLGDQIISELHGRYAEQTMRGNVFSACHQATVTLPASLVSTAPVWTLFNPPGSGKNLSLIDLCFGFGGAPASASYYALVANTNLLQAVPSAVTAVQIRNSFLGGAPNSVAAFYNACTLAAAPIVIRMLGGIMAAAGVTPPIFKDDIGCQIIIQPGCAVSLASNVANSVIGHMSWEEIPI